MDFTSPSAFWALAMTVFASCACAVPDTNARQMAVNTSFLATAIPPVGKRIVLEGTETAPASSDARERVAVAHDASAADFPQESGDRAERLAGPPLATHRVRPDEHARVA